MKTFLPEYSSMPSGPLYIPLFKLFRDEGWRYVRSNGTKVLLPSQREAVAAAKDHVERILNPKLRAEQAEVPEIVADVLGVEEWRQQRESAVDEERAKVFGTEPLPWIRDRKGRQVIVETRRRA